MTFSYDEHGIELVSSQHVDMIAPGSGEQEIQPDQAGFWMALHNENGDVVYRQQLHTPIRHDYEVFSPEPGAPIRRVAKPRVEGVFDVVVPALADAAQITLHGTVGRDDHIHQGPARQLGRFKLERKDARPKGRPQQKRDERDGGGKP